MLGAVLCGALLGPLVPPLARLLASRRPWRAVLRDSLPRAGGWWAGSVTATCIAVDALLWALVVARWGWSAAGLCFGCWCTLLLVASVIDLTEYRIPDRLTFPAMVAVAVAVLTGAGWSGRTDRLVGAAVGGAVLWAGLGVTHLLTPQGMGRGDVKLGVVLGAAVGWAAGGAGAALGAALAAFVVACGIGTVVGLVLLVRRRRNAPYPFGPSLSAGAVVVMLSSGWLWPA